ncbi:winged helix-turn-helix transcriptional regulator [Herbaspirillum huttiense]|uniref:Winged helix-turn-helix transcriptional regulator n=2 Tax=Herbaspirillum huttiense TaxID=863372 RepID=A0AAJ2LSE9_9BURK|nr:winged helix-turn-helix transcriptional regulator [Herbaspirillum huttiense]MDR9837782.1 winged helix-turn-helix transcriptional regulator [Herbaspirillum huttiense]
MFDPCLLILFKRAPASVRLGPSGLAHDSERENGVIDVALLGIIRRWYIRDRISIREIARRLDISRNTVRRYIRAEVSEPSYPARHSPSSLDPFAPRLSAWLSAEAVKFRKQRRTLKQMFLDLRELGYEGSYDRVAAFSRQWKVGQIERVKSASKSTILFTYSAWGASKCG